MFDNQTDRDWDVLAFGETMLRLSSPGFGRLEEAVSLDVRIGGSESNTAVALARLGLRSAWWSKLPANPLGRRIENEIRRWGVDTSAVVWDESPGARAGLYFLDFGLPPRGTDVYYDRAGSSCAQLTALEAESAPLQRARILHASGITPALSPYAAKATARALGLAREAGVQVSFDINYRAKLWSAARARQGLEPLLPMVDLLLCTLEDAHALFGLEGAGPEVARKMRTRYGCAATVITCGGDGAVGCDDRGEWAAAPHALGQVVDRVGAGDAFNAGVIMGWLDGDLGRGISYGAAMAALKHTIPGDLLLSTRSEIDRVVEGGSASIRR